MCGIAGFCHFNSERQVNKYILKRMTDCISHRGPDGEGFYCRNNVALGHRRLSIIDLSTGDQPMYSDDGSIVLIFNGEIYNYVELREELRKLGHRFTTTSDTEVIIQAYRQWGTDCQKKFNGMWAFALWDDNRQQLFLSRDRLGEKTIFYATHDNTLIFGSEIKTILNYGFPAEPNFELTELYLTLSYIPAPYSFYKNIYQLKAGHFLIVTSDFVKENKYWDMPLVSESNMVRDKKKVYAAFEELFYDSVRIRMRSDVPFGAFLSGGLDSAAVVAMMSELSKMPVRTFTVGFKERAFDERKLARLVADKFKTDHEEFIIEGDDFDQSLEKIIAHFDEPFGDSSAIPTGNVSKAAVKRVKMVLTGDGGDEVLSGYTSYQAEKFAIKYQRLPKAIRKFTTVIPHQMARITRGEVRYKLNRIVRVLEDSNLSFDARLMSKMWCNPSFSKDLITHGTPQIKLEDFLSDLHSRYPVNDPFYKLMYFHFKVVLPDDYLMKVDRMSMAHSLETRIPFLDFRLVEYMAHVHKDIKMEGYTRKSILRNTIGVRLPPELLKAPKKGFSVPLREWFKEKAFEERLKELYSVDIGLNNKLIKQLVIENTSGSIDRGNLLWMLFVYKKWTLGFNQATNISGSPGNAVT